jgi:hypothetical protein
MEEMRLPEAVLNYSYRGRKDLGLDKEKVVCTIVLSWYRLVAYQVGMMMMMMILCWTLSIVLGVFQLYGIIL